jgi:hypothetical protein
MNYRQAPPVREKISRGREMAGIFWDGITGFCQMTELKEGEVSNGHHRGKAAYSTAPPAFRFRQKQFR